MEASKVKMKSYPVQEEEEGNIEQANAINKIQRLPYEKYGRLKV